ncbi:hypothetical protein QOT17_025205 [Balamuthia mandrillaris]
MAWIVKKEWKRYISVISPHPDIEHHVVILNLCHKGRILIAGDFNAKLRKEDKPNLNAKVSKGLTAMLKELELVDAYMALHPNSHAMTWAHLNEKKGNLS